MAGIHGRMDYSWDNSWFIMGISWNPTEIHGFLVDFQTAGSDGEVRQAWPALGVESSPSAATLIAIVECLRSKDTLQGKGKVIESNGTWWKKSNS